MNTTRTWFLLFTCIYLLSCEEQIEFNLDEGLPKVVVYGLITDEETLQEIELYTTKSLNGTSYPSPISGATVFIEDNLGNCIYFFQTDTSYISETAFKGEYNKIYTLTVLTSTGQTYKSTPETLPFKSEIDSLYASLEVKQKLNDMENVVEYYEASFFVNNLLPPDSINRFRWKMSGTYEILTYPHLRYQVIPACATNYDGCMCCTCCTCWVNEDMIAVHLSDTKILPENGVINHQLAFKIEMTPIRLFKKYHARIVQQSLSPSGYLFWNSVKRTQNSNQGITSQIPMYTEGNMSNIDDRSEKVFGYFGLSSIARKDLFLRPTDFPNYKTIVPDSIKDDCSLQPNSVNVKPINW